jgi:hypothetical protein
MKPKDLFQLAVRILGLVFLFLAVRHLAPIFHAPGGAYIPIILTTAIYLGAAWWLIGGARSLVQRAYPSESREQHQSQEGVCGHKVDA